MLKLSFVWAGRRPWDPPHSSVPVFKLPRPQSVHTCTDGYQGCLQRVDRRRRTNCGRAPGTAAGGWPTHGWLTAERLAGRRTGASGLGRRESEGHS